jgi:hypothetical protein
MLHKAWYCFLCLSELVHKELLAMVFGLLSRRNGGSSVQLKVERSTPCIWTRMKNVRESFSGKIQHGMSSSWWPRKPFWSFGVVLYMLRSTIRLWPKFLLHHIPRKMIHWCYDDSLSFCLCLLQSLSVALAVAYTHNLQFQLLVMAQRENLAIYRLGAIPWYHRPREFELFYYHGYESTIGTFRYFFYFSRQLIKKDYL